MTFYIRNFKNLYLKSTFFAKPDLKLSIKDQVVPNDRFLSGILRIPVNIIC